MKFKLSHEYRTMEGTDGIVKPFTNLELDATMEEIEFLKKLLNDKEKAGCEIDWLIRKYLRK